MFPKLTEEAIEKVREKMSDGKRLTKEDKVLFVMSDGAWHEANELAYGVSWRFGGYLHNLKKKGVEWEKERVPGTADHIFKYRLCEVE